MSSQALQRYRKSQDEQDLTFDDSVTGARWAGDKHRDGSPPLKARGGVASSDEQLVRIRPPCLHVFGDLLLSSRSVSHRKKYGCCFQAYFPNRAIRRCVSLERALPASCSILVFLI